MDEGEEESNWGELLPDIFIFCRIGSDVFSREGGG